MKKFLIGAAALLTTMTGVMAGASPAQAAWGGHGGGFHGGGGFRGGGGGFHGGGYGYRGGGYGYRGGWGYRGGGWGWGPAFVGGLAVGAALADPYYYGPGPYYPGYYGYYGCGRHWVWTGWGYRPVRACY
ncbi:MAG TPA: hypothetical protein VKQ54_04705 [Caulobacteraceae bacterium]|nr:hypothetical protein [Caulobacteraceae bacterium]